MFFLLRLALEQFQETCETVFRSELRQDKEIERLGVSKAEPQPDTLRVLDYPEQSVMMGIDAA
ncbi:hypothetical protein [Mesorhizobium sp. M1405]|uniref:hypothetical protein n=1 Tax=unclassified Mesorhizobium TaxID=325217 RepID=UPI00333B1F2B